MNSFLTHPAICHCRQIHLSMNWDVRISPTKEIDQLGLFNKFSCWEHSLSVPKESWSTALANDKSKWRTWCTHIIPCMQPHKMMSCCHLPIEKVEGSGRLMQSQGVGTCGSTCVSCVILDLISSATSLLISCFLVDTRSGWAVEEQQGILETPHCSSWNEHKQGSQHKSLAHKSPSLRTTCTAGLPPYPMGRASNAVLSLGGGAG